MREQLIALGTRIKMARKERKMTLQTLADRTGLTAGLLSKIENFRTIPSLPVLVDIAAALETDLAEFFRDMTLGSKARWLLVRPEEQKTVEREEGRHLHYQMILETSLPAVNMQMMYVTIPCGSGGEPVSTEGDELLYILNGRFRYRLGDEVVELTPGDALYFDGTLPHVPENDSGAPGTLIAFYFVRETENQR